MPALLLLSDMPAFSVLSLQSSMADLLRPLVLKVNLDQMWTLVIIYNVFTGPLRKHNQPHPVMMCYLHPGLVLGAYSNEI